MNHQERLTELFGVYSSPVDSSGSISIPEPFRKILANPYRNRLWLSLHTYPDLVALNLWPEYHWKRFLTHYLGPGRKPSWTIMFARQFARRVLPSARRCELDKEGRLFLPYLRRREAFVNSGQAVILGHGYKLVLFTRNSWHKSKTRVLEYQAPNISPDVVEWSQDTYEQLISAIKANPRRVYDISPERFEEFVAEHLERKGFAVEVTPRTNDGGYDVFARSRDEFITHTLVVECKRHQSTNPVGVAVVRGLYGVVEALRANAGLIVTTSVFTRAAKSFSTTVGHRLSLVDYKRLIDWLTK